jgi:hypothetical protein
MSHSQILKQEKLGPEDSEALFCLIDHLQCFDVADEGYGFRITLDCEAESEEEQQNLVRQALQLPETLKLPNVVAHFFYKAADKYDKQNVPGYIHFFQSRGCSFCWHHLVGKKEGTWRKLAEEERLKINAVLLPHLPAF